MRQAPTIEKLRQRLGKADIERIRRCMRMSVGERIQTMLIKQREIISAKREELRALHPELNDLELCRLVFKTLEQSDPIYWC